MVAAIAAGTALLGYGVSDASTADANGGCTDGSAAAARLPTAITRDAVRCLINQQRAAYGLPPLHQSDQLDRAAQGWSDRMVAGDDFSHGDLGARVHAAGMTYRVAGENIATGQRTPRQVVGAWMGSEGHCRNILSPVYRELGTGVNPQPVRGYASGPSTWTVDFALPAGHRRPSSNWGPANGCPY
jgi:uncharacterized protein YkwD